MAKQLLFLILIACFATTVFQASAVTNEVDAQALRDLFRSLNSPQQLNNWKLESGDPCDESWTGVQCFESSIIHLKLNGLGLNGTLGPQLANLRNLKLLDISSNCIEGPIPNSLSLNITHLIFAENRFSESFPYFIGQMIHLRQLNLSHNVLSGPLPNAFTALENLHEMDLSFNSFIGDLPPSFQSLTNVTGLFLESNQLTGSVHFLANLSLSDLNIMDNHFSGMIPERFQFIHNLWIAGNMFDKEVNYAPWKFPLDIIPTQNISSPPTTDLSAIESHSPQEAHNNKKKKSKTVGIALGVTGAALIAACAALATVVLKRRKIIIFKRSGSSTKSMRSHLPVSSVQGLYESSVGEDSPHISSSTFSISPMITPSRLPSVHTKTIRISRRRSFSKTKVAITAKVYTVEDLQMATNSFNVENLLGEGSLGSVYRAEFPDGLILAVKNINTVPLSITEEEKFLDVIRTASGLRHPNIVKLLGYCIEHGQHFIIYEFIRNLSLDDALHCSSYKSLSWDLRVQIAFGIARALDYMHSSAVAHSNLKAGNVLLDEDLIPHICDSGLAILRTLTTNSVKLKASEMAIDDSYYIAPEHVLPGLTSNTKADVYAFGVLLLELFTGRRPYDSSKPAGEQCLVRWASSRLHDSEYLRQMADPAIAKTISSKSLSRFADIVTLCIQPEQEFRPPMSEIVESLIHLMKMTPVVAMDVTREDAQSLSTSFGSTSSPMLPSPPHNYYSM